MPERRTHADIEFIDLNSVSARDGIMSELVRDDKDTENQNKNKNTYNHIEFPEGFLLPLLSVSGFSNISMNPRPNCEQKKKPFTAQPRIHCKKETLRNFS